MDIQEKTKIADILAQRMGHFECPMCHMGSFVLIDGYISTILQSKPDTMIIGGGPSIVSVAIVCNNCGFTSLHNLMALGIIDNNNQNPNADNNSK